MPGLFARAPLWLLLAATLLGACAPPVQPSGRIKIVVEAEGWTSLSASALREAGLDLARIEIPSIQVFDGSTEIPARRTRQAIEFYARPVPDPAIPESVYWMRWGVERGLDFESLDSAPRGGAPASSHTAALTVEQNRLFEPQATGDAWFWQTLVGPAEIRVPISLPGRLPGPVEIAIDLWSASEAEQTRPDHRLRIEWNGTLVAEETWDGVGQRSIGADLPERSPVREAAVLTLRLPGTTGAPAEVIHLDRIRLRYPRAMRAVEGALTFETSAPLVRVDGFDSPEIVLLDVTDAARPIRLEGAAVAADDADWSATFAPPAGSPRRILARRPSATPHSPRRVERMSSLDLRAPHLRADEIVVTVPEFVEALAPLAMWREAQGTPVLVVTADQVFDSFSFGRPDPAALRDFFSFAMAHWQPPPRFVLLVGKASYDVHDHLRAANRNLVPTRLLPTPHLAQAGSDNWFVAGPDDPAPRLSIGRIPAESAAQVRAAVGKVLAYESSAADEWKSRAVFVADPTDPRFALAADALAARLPTGVRLTRIVPESLDAELEAGRAAVLRAWDEGALLMAYVGHGSMDSWARGPLFSTREASELANGDRLPILLTPSCLDGFFYHPHEDSLAEVLLFNPDGGIVAGIVPTGLSLPDSQEVLARALLDAWFDGQAGTLGEALTIAKQPMPGNAPEHIEVLETFVLLGDPALQLPQP